MTLDDLELLNFELSVNF